MNYEAGARSSAGPKRLELIGFFNDYSNLTDICTLSSSCSEAQLDSQFSAGKAHIYGLEAYGSYELRLGPVGVSAAPPSRAARRPKRFDAKLRQPLNLTSLGRRREQPVREVAGSPLR